MDRISSILLTAVLCFALPDGACAQRYLPGQQGLQFTAGTVNGVNTNPKSSDFAFHAGMAFSTCTGNGNRWVLGGEYLEKRHPYGDMEIPQSQFTAEGGYYLNVLSDGSKTFFLSAGASVLAGYETVRHNDKPLPDGATILNRDALLYGGALTLETEIFLTDWLVLLANVRERLLAGSSVGKFNTQLGLGIKILIN
ncbi:MAG: conjugal transfer protein TraO [Bacteroidales bacterium]|jgi:hypothetical protein|nr:conjugal transfer protein TraO [Bacteroidales bacterium]